MHYLTAALLNIDQPQLTIDVLEKLANLPPLEWSVQLILVDNGSQLDKLQQLSAWLMANKERFAELLFIASSKNQGVNGGRNIILKLATEDRVLILDNDVILPDSSAWLETLWQRLDDDPKVAIVGPTLVFSDHPDIVQAAGIGLTDQGRVGYLGRAKAVGDISQTPLAVVSTPAACWLLRREAQQAVGLFSDEYYPMQYEDVDFCVRLGLAGWKIICERSVAIKHIENITTRHLIDYPFARLTVKQALLFRKKWAEILPKIATLSDEDIYWGPIPEIDN